MDNYQPSDEIVVEALRLDFTDKLTVSEIEVFGKVLGMVRSTKMYTMKPYYINKLNCARFVEDHDSVVEDRTVVVNQGMNIGGDGSLYEWVLVSDYADEIHWELNRTGFVYDAALVAQVREQTTIPFFDQYKIGMLLTGQYS